MDRRPASGAGRSKRGAWIAAVLLVMAVGCVRVEPEQATAEKKLEPELRLAQVHAASQDMRSPGIVVTVTRREVHVDATELHEPRGEVEPRTRFEFFEVGKVDAEGPLGERLAQLVALVGAKTLDDSRVRLRIAADVPFRDVMPVFTAMTRAMYGTLELEVVTAKGVGQLELRPYVWCACRVPSRPSWCAAPLLRVDREGVTVRGSADLTPHPGCYKAVLYRGESEPLFTAEVDWRDRPIAGPQGDCPSAAVTDGELDVVALVDRLRALQRVAPGCQWMAVEVDDEAPWSLVAPTLAAAFAEFGPLRTRFGPVSREYCSHALPLTELSPAPPGPAPPVFRGRVGCVE